MSSLKRAVSFTGSRTGAVVATLLVATLMATGAVAAEKPAPGPAPQLSERKARIAQGATVPLAASSLTAAELAILRPDFEKLKPRKRTNAE